VIVDSRSPSALTGSGSAHIKAGSIGVVGGVSQSGNASFSPVVRTGITAVPDPLAGLAVPVASRLGLTTQGAVNLSGSSTATISPGIYSQITVSSYASLTLKPGVYIIAGGGITVSGFASITGQGVLIFNAGTGYNAVTGSDGGTFGSINLSGNGKYALSAPASGTYAGILIFQERTNARTLALSGNTLIGTAGTIYAPLAPVTLSGNAVNGTSQQVVSFIVDSMTLSGTATANNLGGPAAGTVAYTPAQVRTAYGISSLPEDGIGQTIAIVDAHNDPAISQSLDAFDTKFGLTYNGYAAGAGYNLVTGMGMSLANFCVADLVTWNGVVTLSGPSVAPLLRTYQIYTGATHNRPAGEPSAFAAKTLSGMQGSDVAPPAARPFPMRTDDRFVVSFPPPNSSLAVAILLHQQSPTSLALPFQAGIVGAHGNVAVERIIASITDTREGGKDGEARSGARFDVRFGADGVALNLDGKPDEGRMMLPWEWRRSFGETRR
jgi:hypothetical protein